MKRLFVFTITSFISLLTFSQSLSCSAIVTQQPTCPANATNFSCNGSILVSATGGTSPYTGTGTINNLCGTYTGFVTDAVGAQCSYTVFFGAINNFNPSFVKVKPLCFGDCNGSLQLNLAGGTSPYTYSWAPTAQTTQTETGLCAGNYVCYTIDANGCQYTTPSTVLTQPTLLSVTTTTTPASCPTCCNGSATATIAGGTSPYTYSWYTVNETTQTATGLCAQCYTVLVTDANGCTAYDVACVNFSVGTNEIENELHVSVYPNPSTGNFTIETENIEGTIEIHNLLGEIIFQSAICNQKSVIDLSSQPNGIYLLQVRSEKGILTKKIIKE